MATNPNRDEFYGNSPSDIKLSTWEYHDFVDALIDDRLSARGLMKFKNLYTHISFNLFATPIVAFPPAFILTKWLVGIIFPYLRLDKKRHGFFPIQLSRHGDVLPYLFVRWVHKTDSKEVVYINNR